ncbi:MAG TPA: succinylglutamate desuccinylase/aspartoacylase family protein [Actinomycetota bacterium]
MTASKPDRGPSVWLSGNEIQPGRKRMLEIPFARLPTGTRMSLPVTVVNGYGDGPQIWLSSTVHGDELNGIEIIRRVMRAIDPRTLAGSVIAIPILNVFGFISESRYLPDRRDLNRAFPGSPRGSLAARLAHFFMEEIAGKCGYGIDFHTGSDDRTNLPQIRTDLTDPETRRCAEAFAAPILIHSRVRDGSMREAATARGVHVLLFEGGEALRFDDDSIAVGVAGTLRVMAALGMREPDPGDEPSAALESESTVWVRARRSGIVRLNVHLGERVRARQALGVIADAFGEDEVVVRAPVTGVVIGMTRNPLASQGEGLVHVAQVADQAE